MTDPETDGCAETAREPASRALVVLPGGRESDRAEARLRVPARPMAGFLTQLILADNPDLRPTRRQRTGAAAALYAAAGSRR